LKDPIVNGQQFAIVPIAAILDNRLSKMQLRVLTAILSFRQKNTDVVWVRRSKIATRCGYQENSITKVTAQLVELGWLEKTGRGGFSKPNEYRVLVPKTYSGSDEVNAEDTYASSEEVNPKLPTPNREENLLQTGKKTYSGSEEGNIQTYSNIYSNATAVDEFDYLAWEPEQRLIDFLSKGKGIAIDDDVLTKFKVYASEQNLSPRTLGTRLTSWLQGEKNSQYRGKPKSSVADRNRALMDGLEFDEDGNLKGVDS
jgi:hypothetical protein